jgi:hypothetical protein
MKRQYELTTNIGPMYLNGPIEIAYLSDDITIIHFDGMSADGILQTILIPGKHFEFKKEIKW